MHDDLGNEYLHILNLEGKTGKTDLNSLQLNKIDKTYITEAQRNIVHYDKAINEIEGIITQIDTKAAE